MTTITATSPREVLALIPFQLGFNPQDSLVLVGLRQRQVGLVVRVDLHDTADTADTLIRHLRNDGATGTFAVLYTDNPSAVAVASQHVARAARHADLPVLGAWVVDAGLYTPLAHDGTPVGPVQAINADTTVVAATCVAAGSAPRTRREDLEITPASPGQRGCATRARNTARGNPATPV